MDRMQERTNCKESTVNGTKNKKNSALGKQGPRQDTHPSKYSGVARDISMASAFPKFFQIPPPSVRMMYPSALRSHANFAPHISLSITASTPCRVVGQEGTRLTGTPPPPHAMTSESFPLSSSVEMASIWRISSGSGLGTTRR